MQVLLPLTFIGLLSAAQPFGYDITNLLSVANVPLLVTSDGSYNVPTMVDESSTLLIGHSLDTLLKVCITSILGSCDR